MDRDKFWMGKPQPHTEREAKPIVTTRWRNESGPPFCHPVPKRESYLVDTETVLVVGDVEKVLN